MNAGKKLRDLLKRDEILVAPGAHDGISAKIIEKLGFNAIYGTGYGASASRLGKPDAGLMTLTEMTTHMHSLACNVNIPVIADGDTGFGNAVNAMRAVQEYEAAGVAAIQLEDQVLPKKCGHMLGREIVSTEEMVGKIRAAKSARNNPDFCIIARTDARTKYGIDETLRRIEAFANAGADIIFAESLESEEEMRRVNELTNLPSLANMVEKGRTPILSSKELYDLGYKIVIWPVTSVLIEAKALFKAFEMLKADGTTKNFFQDMYGFEEFNNLLGLEDIRRYEQEFAGRAAE
ncbi:MAG TPA: oxaloacetate decarboxylase [Clostridiales bacterium]|jgi:carboxyvinyl-carboxyphosphonate phosphorylmutase|nr:oxaloacetate decarboxylase [Clostridiales bacterium]